MKHDQLTHLCNLFNLGTPTAFPTKVLGGLLHRMWRISTDKGTYAIKQLSPHIDLAKTAVVRNYKLFFSRKTLIGPKGTKRLHPPPVRGSSF